MSKKIRLTESQFKNMLKGHMADRCHVLCVSDLEKTVKYLGEMTVKEFHELQALVGKYVDTDDSLFSYPDMESAEYAISYAETQGYKRVD